MYFVLSVFLSWDVLWCFVLFGLVFFVFLQCFDTVGCVIWPVKTRPHMTYIVLVGRKALLNQLINQSINEHFCRHVLTYLRNAWTYYNDTYGSYLSIIWGHFCSHWFKGKGPGQHFLQMQCSNGGSQLIILCWRPSGFFVIVLNQLSVSVDNRRPWNMQSTTTTGCKLQPPQHLQYAWKIARLGVL